VSPTGLKKFILSDFFVQYMLRGIVLGIPLHEYCHLVALRLLGGRGEIVSWALNEMQWLHDPNTLQMVATAYAGGVCSGLIWLLLSWRDEDEENRLISRILGLNQIVYGLFEGTAFLLGNYGLIGTGSLIAGTLMIGALVAYILTRLEQVVPT
jgi:hypothetical protein